MSDTTGNNSFPNNVDDIKKVKDSLQEISNSMTRVAGERDFIKETKKKLKDDFGIAPKMVTRLAKTMFNDDFDSTNMDHDEFVAAYKKVTNAR